MAKKSDKLFEKSGSFSDNLRIHILSAIEDLIIASGSSGLATEATLISVLNAINNTQQDVEILLVRDKGNGNVVLQQITDYLGGAPVVTYKDVNGNVVVPVGPLEYLDPAAVLNLVLAELQTLNAGGQLATQTTLAAVNTKLTATTGVASTLLVVTGAGAASVAAGKRTVSFFNSGNADASVNGATLARGVGITYPELANRDVYAAIPYDALTSELTITTVG